MYLSVKQVAKRWAVSRSTIYKMIDNGKLPCIRAGNVIRIDSEDVDNISGSNIPSSYNDTAPRLEGYVTTVEASALTGRSDSTILEASANGRFKSVKIGSRRYFKKDELLAHYGNRNRNIPISANNETNSEWRDFLVSTLAVVRKEGYQIRCQIQEPDSKWMDL